MEHSKISNFYPAQLIKLGGHQLDVQMIDVLILPNIDQLQCWGIPDNIGSTQMTVEMVTVSETQTSLQTLTFHRYDFLRISLCF